MLGIVLWEEIVSARSVKTVLCTCGCNNGSVDVVCFVKGSHLFVSNFAFHAAYDNLVFLGIVFGILQNHHSLILHTALLGHFLGSGVCFVQYCLCVEALTDGLL